MTSPQNTLLRSERCATCGEMMLWTQGAWAHGNNRGAAYRCLNGHVLDPATTRECPTCGLHDTHVVEQLKDQTAHACNACGARFALPHSS